MLPPKDKLTICFAHAAYRMQERFDLRGTGIRSIEVRDRASLEAAIAEADVLSVSGLWNDALIPRAPKLRFIQSISAGVDQYGKDALRGAGIRLASAQGANARAVAEHAMALILALSRLLPEARDNQAKRHWRGMIGDLSRREDELGGKTLLIVGLGRIGGRLAQLAKAFDLKVIGIRRDPAGGQGAANSVHALGALKSLLPQADFVALTCPLTPETEGLIDAEALALMRPSAHLVNVARGRVCVEAAVVEAMAEQPYRRRRARLHRGRAAAAGQPALGHAECADHPAYRRRDPALRGQCDRPAAGEPRPAVARRGDPEEFRSSERRAPDPNGAGCHG